MKNIAIIIASIFLFGTAALAGENKNPLQNKMLIGEKISNMLGYPSDILAGTSQVIMISYSVDTNNIIHVDEILSPNIALKQYVLKHMDGKKMKNIPMEEKNGVVKVHFNGDKNEKLHLQF